MRRKFDMQQINLLRITKTISSSITKYFNQENENTPKKKTNKKKELEMKKKISGRLQISLLILGEFKQIN